MKLVKITGKYSRLIAKFEKFAAQYAKIPNSAELNDTVYFNLFNQFEEQLTKAMGRYVSISREDSYEANKVLEYTNAILNGYTFLLVDDDVVIGHWAYSVYTQQAVKAIDQFLKAEFKVKKVRGSDKLSILLK